MILRILKLKLGDSMILKAAFRNSYVFITAVVLGVLVSNMIFAFELAKNQNDKLQFINNTAGKYAHYDIVAYKQKLARGTMKSLVITYGFTEFKKRNGGLVAKESYCHAEQLTNQPFKSSIPDSFTRNIIPPEAKVTIENTNGIFSIYRPETPTPIGLELDDWVNDPFPTKIDDERFVDHDEDGKPGVTVKIKMFWLFPAEIYIARREIFSYRVFPKEGGELHGDVYDRSEQIVLGSSIGFAKFPNTPVVQDENLKKSPIILVPVEDDYDCDKLMKNRNKLFPKNPKP